MSEEHSTHDVPPRGGDPLGDVINLLAAPLASGIRSYEQFRRGVDELFRTVENLNATMENLNETAERVNRLLADVEGPIRAMVPRMTRTITAADEFMDAVGGPATRAAPNLVRLVDTLTTPAFVALPERVDEIVGVMSEVSRRLHPLAQVAESAGGMFGIRVPGMSRPAATPPPEEPVAATSPATKKAPAKKRAATKSPATERATTKRAATKKAPARRGAR